MHIIPFNGAAAKSSGKYRARACGSSRPRAFNGAAAKSSGKWNAMADEDRLEPTFNGAAAKSSGKFQGVRLTFPATLTLQWGRR